MFRYTRTVVVSKATTFPHPRPSVSRQQMAYLHQSCDRRPPPALTHSQVRQQFPTNPYVELRRNTAYQSWSARRLMF